MYVVWYTAMSMDGRIADAAGRLDFLTAFGDDAAQDFDPFIASIDAVIIGGNTMRWLIDNGHGWPHGDMETWLVSRDEQLVERIGHTDQPLHRVSGDIGAICAEIEQRGHHRVWLCGGGDLAAQALTADRIDEVIVTIAPTVVGAGPSIFDGENLPVNAFSLETCRPWQGGGARLVWRRTHS